VLSWRQIVEIHVSPACKQIRSFPETLGASDARRRAPNAATQAHCPLQPSRARFREPITSALEKYLRHGRATEIKTIGLVYVVGRPIVEVLRTGLVCLRKIAR
jgi:hypothetical protein